MGTYRIEPDGDLSQEEIAHAEYIMQICVEEALHQVEHGNSLTRYNAKLRWICQQVRDMEAASIKDEREGAAKLLDDRGCTCGDIGEEEGDPHEWSCPVTLATAIRNRSSVERSVAGEKP